jgi:hypothetical protein
MPVAPRTIPPPSADKRWSDACVDVGPTEAPFVKGVAAAQKVKRLEFLSYLVSTRECER